MPFAGVRTRSQRPAKGLFWANAVVAWVPRKAARSVVKKNFFICDQFNLLRTIPHKLVLKTRLPGYILTTEAGKHQL